MMKKVMFVVVSLLLVSYCFALESAPSNKVGYVKLSVAGGTGNAYTAFGLPFVFWDVPTGNVPTYGVESRKPSDIFGTQPFCGTSLNADRVIRTDVGRYAYRGSPSCVWTNTLETNPADVEPGHGYQIRTTNQAPKTYVLAGEADTTAIGIPAVAINGGSPTPSFAGYSWRDPRELAVNRLNLLASGFTGGNINTSDRIVGGSQYAYFRTTDNTWQGTLTTITPGKSYYIVSKHNPGWTYTYNASGAALTLPTKGDDANIMKVNTPVKTTKAVKTNSQSATN